MPNLNVEFFEPRDIPSIGALWRSLESETGNNSLPCSWDWVECWVRHYGDIVPHQFAIAKRGDRIRAVALITRASIRQGPFQIRRVSVGTAGEPDQDSVCVEYNQFLSFPEDRDAFARELLSSLGELRDWDEFFLEGFEEPTAAPFLSAAPFHAEKRVTRFFDFTRLKPGDVLLASMERSARRKVEYSLRKLGELTPEWAADTAQAKEFLAELIDLHQRRWESAGHSGSFASERFKRFHSDLIERLLPQGRVYLFRVLWNGRTLGCLYGFIENGAARFYQSGFASLADNKIAPGYVAHALCMDQCRSRGLREYDFLTGDSYYKQLFSNGQRDLLWAGFRRAKLKFQAVDALRKIKTWITPRRVKQAA